MKPTLALTLMLLAACTRPGEERAVDELAVGAATSTSVALEVDDGLAAIRALTDDAATLWSGAPTLELTVTANAPLALDLTFLNALPDATLTSPDAELAIAPLPAAARVTTRGFRVTAPAGSYRLRLAAADADDAAAPFRVVAMADIQTALPTVDQVFARIAATPDVRFVVCMGDLTERAEVAEYDLFEAQLATLPVPFYTTLGNHELWADHGRWLARFGRASFQFTFHDVAFTFMDSGNGGLDPLVHAWVDDWLEVAHDRLHLTLTHFPTVEPSGTRAGSFRDHSEALDLLQRMAAAGVDLALYGHIHTLLTYEHAGIPAWISGGGGATQEKWDGIGRHFLTIDLDPAARSADVGVIRVDS